RAADDHDSAVRNQGIGFPLPAARMRPDAGKSIEPLGSPGGGGLRGYRKNFQRQVPAHHLPAYSKRPGGVRSLRSQNARRFFVRILSGSTDESGNCLPCQPSERVLVSIAYLVRRENLCARTLASRGVPT